MHSSLKEQMFFARRLAFLVGSGVPLVESVTILQAQARGRHARRRLQSVLTDIANGQSLSKSFSKFPRVFNNLTVSMLKVGEESGNLAVCLNHLCEELKKRHLLVRKVMSAFLYPCIIMLASVGIVVFLMLYLFPKILPVFSSLRMQLPLSTRMVMGFSSFLGHWGLVVLAASVLLSVATAVLLTYSCRAHLYFDRVLLRVPAFGSVVRSYNAATITRTLGLLLRSGMQLSEALSIVQDTTKNLVYKAHLRELTACVERGERISVRILQARYFPAMVGDMLAVGERSGTLEGTLSYLAEFYEHEVDEFTKNLSTLIEPVLMVAMGLVVGFIAISIITPIYGITQNLHA